MSDHLPECRWNWPCRHEDWTHEPMEDNEWVCCECGNDCLCRELESCEQRVRDEIEADGPWFKTVVHQCCEGKQTAYAAGLSAAREAVEVLPVSLVDTRFDPDDERRYVQAVRLTTALAAIDALREKT